MSSPRAITHSAYRRAVMGRNSVVTSAECLASQAGIRIMMAGGNAIDGVMATAAAPTGATREFYLERDGILLKEGLSVSIPDLVDGWPLARERASCIDLERAFTAVPAGYRQLVVPTPGHSDRLGISLYRRGYRFSLQQSHDLLASGHTHAGFWHKAPGNRRSPSLALPAKSHGIIRTTYLRRCAPTRRTFS